MLAVTAPHDDDVYGGVYIADGCGEETVPHFSCMLQLKKNTTTWSNSIKKKNYW